MKTGIFEDYDCIGFDLDNTIAVYNEPELANLVYELVVEHLIDRNYFDPVDLRKPIASDVDFLRKGLTIDTARGNILSLAEDGSILQAHHGTLPLSVSQIQQIYGPDMKWDLAVKHCNDFLSTWNGDSSEKIFSCLDYFNVLIPLLFARVIDSVDRKYSPSTEYNVWPKIMEGVSSILYVGNIETCLPGSESQYHHRVLKNLSKYLRKRSKQFLMLLNSLKSKGKKTFLITGSEQSFATAIASYVMSDEWMESFDVIVFNAKKPGFFVQNRPFLTVDTGNVVEDSQLAMNGRYTQGNWSALYQLFCRATEKSEPKCLYIGDNLVEDVYTPVKHNCCDTIAVVKELQAKDEKDEVSQSKVWGSFFYDHHNSKRTAWGKIIENYPESCIRSVEWLVKDLPTSYEEKMLSVGDQH